MESSHLSAHAVERIRTSRKSAYYRDAVALAQRMFLHRTPALSSGRLPVTAVLFNMNELFESYLTRRFVEAMRTHPDVTVTAQVRRPFWNLRGIRPDMIVDHPGGRVAVDAKWKILERAVPSDADLKQMYGYGRFFGCRRTVLVYPHVGLEGMGAHFKDDAASCEVAFCPLVEVAGESVRLADFEPLVSSILRLS